MADINKLVPILLKFEGGYVNDPSDLGGATNLGITLGTAEKFHFDEDHDGDVDVNDVKLLTKEDFRIVLKVGYWDVWRADEIKNQSIANFLVDWLYNSGVDAIRIPQRLLGLTPDGVVGKNTIDGVNKVDQQNFFNQLVEARNKFITDIIIKRPANKKFEIGWRNRINSFKFQG